MSSLETISASASDVLADLDELDSVLGVETLDQQDLKPKRVRIMIFLPCGLPAVTARALFTDSSERFG